MILIGIDPSIRVTGIAVLNMDSTEVYEARAIKPIPQRGPWTQRIDSIIEQLANIIGLRPVETRIIMEDLSNHVYTTRHGGGGVGLATYGAVVGAIRQRFIRQVTLLDQSAWNARQWKNKTGRARRVVAEFPALAEALEDDKGHDISDAAAIAIRWHQLEIERRIS